MNFSKTEQEKCDLLIHVTA